MKTTVLLISFIFITGALLGQKNEYNFIDSDIRKEYNFIDSDIRKQFFTNPDRSPLRKPNLCLPKKFDFPTLQDLDTLRICPDSLKVMDENHRLYSDLFVTEEFPGASRFMTTKVSYNQDFWPLTDCAGKKPGLITCTRMANAQ